MKILRDGNTLESLFPYDSHLRCRSCHCEFQIEPGDPWERVPPTRNEQAMVRVPCPQCGRPVVQAGPLDYGDWADLPAKVATQEAA